MNKSFIALATVLAMGMAIPAEAGGSRYGSHGKHDRGGPILGAKAGAQVTAKINVLNIVKVKAGVGLGLGLGLGGR